MKLFLNGYEVEGTANEIAKLISKTKTNSQIVSKSEKPVIALRKGSELKKAFQNIQADNAEMFVQKCLDIANGQGIHTVFSGMNDLIRNKFNSNPALVTKGMMEAGLIKGHPSKGGFTINR